MSAIINFTPSGSLLRKFNPLRSSHFNPSRAAIHVRTSPTPFLSQSVNHTRNLPVLPFCTGGGGGGSNGVGNGGGGGDGEGSGDGNKNEAILALAEIGRSLDSLPKDMAAAIESGKIPVSIVLRYLELEKFPLFRWLFQFGGFRERLLADDLFLAKVAMECSVGNGGGGGDGEGSGDGNKNEAILALAEIGRSLDSLPKDLVAAIESGKIPGSIVLRYLELDKSSLFRWLLQFGGFRERLLADDLFLAKVAMECGVGFFTKTAAEYERLRENFFNELEVVLADVVMPIIADFMLVWLPPPTVSLRPAISLSAGPIAKFFYGCPDNAFQVALAGTSYSLLQRIGAIVRNRSKLFVVGTTSLLVGTVVTNALINARKAVDKSAGEEVENVPIMSTSVAYGVYMAVSSNLRYQVVAGVNEQRMLEPSLHQHKLILSALCFAVPTGNTFWGSLLLVFLTIFSFFKNL